MNSKKAILLATLNKDKKYEKLDFKEYGNFLSLGMSTPAILAIRLILTLSLFVFWVLADNHNYTFTLNYFALGTYFFY